MEGIRQSMADHRRTLIGHVQPFSSPSSTGYPHCHFGHPAHQVMCTDEALEKLKAIGFNEVQLNIAWRSRPFGEALNLIDVAIR